MNVALDYARPLFEAACHFPRLHDETAKSEMWRAPLHDPPQFARLVVGCLPSPRKHYIVVGRRAALENELRLRSRFVVDGAEVVAGKDTTSSPSRTIHRTSDRPRSI